MTVLALLFFVAAATLFAVAAANVAARVNLVALGLAVLTVGWIVQFTVHGAPV